MRRRRAKREFFLETWLMKTCRVDAAAADGIRSRRRITGDTGKRPPRFSMQSNAMLLDLVNHLEREPSLCYL